MFHCSMWHIIGVMVVGIVVDQTLFISKSRKLQQGILYKEVLSSRVQF